ncbi:lipopolysaccharide-induced tumor necrosis factor-alpha factor homolog isoform X2 [Nerophis ophidion]|uniref:lipopolysaccharide-induced tumor necrosis factor-alpha factor homolog isoform X2 n=1 Tax=Nerophis ophidion TaxID=159077 RepID=UPI002ADF2F45|nr:lipopolysaccharide-induced tumor necrosis factor-alpha factor homolog isoform X2 [Nerophis ophidion]
MFYKTCFQRQSLYEVAAGLSLLQARHIMQVANVDPLRIQPPPYPGTQETVVIHQSQFAVQTVEVPVVQYAVPQVRVVHPAPASLLTDVPGQVTCINCHTHGITRTRYINGALTWVIAGVLGFFCFWPCLFIPFCLNTCKDVEHSCSTCGTVLHIHKQMS